MAERRFDWWGLAAKAADIRSLVTPLAFVAAVVLVMLAVFVNWLQGHLWLAALLAPFMWAAYEEALYRRSRRRAAMVDPRTKDPALDKLVADLQPLVEQAEFLMTRRARRGESDPLGFIAEADEWASKVSCALDGFSSWKRHFESEPPLPALDTVLGRTASFEFEHRYRMLGEIIDVIKGRTG